jgi:hypothetical protein
VFFLKYCDGLHWFSLYAHKRAQQSLFLPGFNAGSEAVPGPAALQSLCCLMRRRTPNALNSLTSTSLNQALTEFDSRRLRRNLENRAKYRQRAKLNRAGKHRRSLRGPGRQLCEMPTMPYAQKP